MVYQHPLAYLLGLEGIALLRAFCGEYDREFTEARLAEIRSLLEEADVLGEGGWARPVTTVEGYRMWADSYDHADNQMIDLEEPVVWEILDGLPCGVALDAACGTGRHAARLAELGHDVLGVDNSAEMLAHARAKVPSGCFYEADLCDLPVPDNHVDVLVCALALTHLPDLGPVLAEFVRVLKPGGHLVISDSRGLVGEIGIPLVKPQRDGTFGYMPRNDRRTSDYLMAALPLGFQLRRCEEPRRPFPLVDAVRRPTASPAPVPPNIWALHAWATEATNTAYRDSPAVIVLHFQLTDG